MGFFDRVRSGRGRSERRAKQTDLSRFPKICWSVEQICALPSLHVDNKKSEDQIWDRGRKHKIANSEETALVTPIFSGFK